MAIKQRRVIRPFQQKVFDHGPIDGIGVVRRSIKPKLSSSAWTVPPPCPQRRRFPQGINYYINLVGKMLLLNNG